MDLISRVLPDSSLTSFLQKDSGLKSSGTQTLFEHRKIQSSTKASSDITILTKEGDRITLSFDAIREMSSETTSLRARRESSDGSSIAIDAYRQESSLSSETRVQMTIEGDLNEQERAEVRQAIESIEDMMADFVAGETEDALAHAAEIGTLDSLASTEATFSITQSVQIDISSQARTMLTETARESDGIRPEHGDRRGGGRLARRIDKLIEKFIREIEKADGDPKKIAKKIEKASDRFMRHLGKQLDHHRGKMEHAENLRSIVVEQFHQRVTETSFQSFAYTSAQADNSPAIDQPTESGASEPAPHEGIAVRETEGHEEVATATAPATKPSSGSTRNDLQVDQPYQAALV